MKIVTLLVVLATTVTGSTTQAFSPAGAATIKGGGQAKRRRVTKQKKLQQQQQQQQWSTRGTIRQEPLRAAAVTVGSDNVSVNEEDGTIAFIPPPPPLLPQPRSSTFIVPTADVIVDDGKASMSSEIFSLAKTIIGASCFGLPAAIAAYGSAPSAILSACLVIAGIGSMSGYGFSLIGRVCSYTGATSYQEAWAKTVSPKSAWMVSGFSVLVCLSSLLAYTMVLTDTTIKLATGFAGISLSKPQALVSLMIPILLPLCRLKELKKLAPFAMMGIGAILYTVFVMGLRYAQGAYALGGKFATVAAATASSPAFGSVGAAGIFSPSAFVLIGMLATAFSSHYNAPKFYNELRDNTVPRYNAVVGSGYLLAGLTYILVAAFGFLTFGTASGPMVLHNYAANDGLINVARLAVAGSILTSYPLTFTGVRDSVLDLCKVKNRSNKVLDGVTVGLLATLAILSLLVTDLGAVWAIGGATYGTALTVLIPPFMFVQCVLKKQPKEWMKLRKEIPLAVGTAVLGLGMGVIGTFQAIQKFRVVA